ncbi:toxin-antitoxin system antidote Mnt family protein [Skermanella aerolata]|uniref:Toxin-antitoxin system antidote Mnt family protein n=1 Tax=Skermanella aerolata TaxID=393310 RepID=A0A512DSL0_9PROT|nr:nucleotidyltransferase domain-containing protein [Skermanella aerolata]GEO39462.1 toxin-antitoxin system antidote Mnt family protein [Skermanella aerolata]
MITDSDILAAVREALPGVRRVYLFGSRAIGEEWPDSDLDLAVVLDGPADSVSLWMAGEDIASRLDVDVDLIDLLKADTVLKHQIVTNGKLLFTNDPVEAERYEIFILNDMMELNEARRPLIADIMREGRLNGR